MTVDEYLKLLDWTGRQVRLDKRGAIPADLAPILDRLQITGELWVATVLPFRRSHPPIANHVVTAKTGWQSFHFKTGCGWLPVSQAAIEITVRLR
jgi:hypothetical protein